MRSVVGLQQTWIKFSGAPCEGLNMSLLAKFEGPIWMPATQTSTFFVPRLLNNFFNRWRYQKIWLIRKLRGLDMSLLAKFEGLIWMPALPARHLSFHLGY